MKLMKVSEFRRTYFTEGSIPDVKTIKKAIDNGELVGQTIGNMYYVDVDRLGTSNNPLVNKVLAA